MKNIYEAEEKRRASADEEEVEGVEGGEGETEEGAEGAPRYGSHSMGTVTLPFRNLARPALSAAGKKKHHKRK